MKGRIWVRAGREDFRGGVQFQWTGANQSVPIGVRCHDYRGSEEAV